MGATGLIWHSGLAQFRCSGIWGKYVVLLEGKVASELDFWMAPFDLSRLRANGNFWTQMTVCLPVHRNELPIAALYSG
jgi:hypothetical protein